MTDRDWAIRTAAYRYFGDHSRAPDCKEIAALFGISADEARAAYHRLHDAHALFLDPGTSRIRMLNPFSNVPTPYVVEVDGKSYHANCAWDMLAIPGMLGRDALIHARLEVAGTNVQIPVQDGLPRPDRAYVVNYSIPFRNWYVDLAHT